MSDARSDLEADVAVMRRLGVTEWKDIKLGPAPLPTETSSKPGPTPEEQARRDQVEHRRIALAASGGLKPRSGV